MYPKIVKCASRNKWRKSFLARGDKIEKTGEKRKEEKEIRQCNRK